MGEETFPEAYDPVNFAGKTPPIHVLKNGMSKGKWKAKDTLKNKANFIEHLYVLPFSSVSNKSVVIDFRDITFITQSKLSGLKLIKRVNDPMITDILDKISGIYNRKGLPPILPFSINPLNG